MSFLNDLAGKAQQRSKQLYAQANPLDGGRTYQNMAPRPVPASTVQQGTALLPRVASTALNNVTFGQANNIGRLANNTFQTEGNLINKGIQHLPQPVIRPVANFAADMTVRPLLQTGQHAAQLAQNRNPYQGTSRQQVGQVGTDLLNLASVLPLGKAAQGAKELAAGGRGVKLGTRIAEGAKTGARVGALPGAAYGGAQQAFQTMQQNGSNEDIGQGLVRGASIGFVGGAALGAAGGAAVPVIDAGAQTAIRGAQAVAKGGKAVANVVDTAAGKVAAVPEVMAHQQLIKTDPYYRTNHEQATQLQQLYDRNATNGLSDRNPTQIQIARQIADSSAKTADMRQAMVQNAKQKVVDFAQEHPVGLTSGAVNDAGERVGLNGKPLNSTGAASTKPAPVLPSAVVPKRLLKATETGAKPAKGSLPDTTPDTAISRFPNRLLEEDRTAPIHKTLLQNVTHEIKHNAPVLEATAKKIAQNEDAALSLAKRGSSTEANATALQLMDKYLKEGNFEKARDLVQTVAPRFTRQGQETQILSQYSKLSPAGAVRYANSELAHAVQNTPKGKALEDTTVTAHQAIQSHAKEVANQVTTELSQGKIGKTLSAAKEAVAKEAKTPEQMLADRIKATSDKSNKPDPIKDMVNTLHQVAKEVLPQQGKKAPRDPMQLIGQAIKDKANYKGVYEKAQRIVAEKYKNNPAALEELDKYFNSQISRPFSKNQLNKGVQNGLKGTDLSKIVKQHFTKVDETGQALKDKLIQQAGLSKDEATQLAGHIQSRYDELVQGRKDSIIKQMFGDKPKPAQLSAADRILTMHNLGALSRDEIRPLVAQKLGVPSLSEEATKNISGMANKIQTLTEGSPERMRATVEMMRYIADQVPQSATSKGLSIWKAGLLSGVKTQQGNAISNGMFAGLKKVSDVPAVLADKAISLKTGQRTVGLTMRGGGQGAAKGFKTGLDTMRTGIDMRDPISSGKYEQHSELKFNNKLANNLIAKPTNTVFRGMGAADQPWYYGAEGNSIMDQAKAQGINQGLRGKALQDYMTQAAQGPGEAIQARALQESGKAVLGYDTVASRAINAVNQSIENSTMSPAGKAAAKTVINVLAPFTKVPSAFISRTIDFTPLGIPKTVISQVSHGQFDQRALSQAIGEATTGTGLIALGVALSQKNLVSGDYPKNDQKEAERWKAEGITPNSVKVGNKWVSMNYLGPVGLLFNAGHQIAQAGQKGEGAMTKAFAAAGGLGQGLLGQSFLQGFSGFTNAVTDPQQSAKKYLNSQVASIVPSIVNDAANVTDKFQRQANGVTDSIKNRIPGLREGNAIKQDVYGNNLKQPAGQLNTLNGLKPSNSTTNKNPAIAEVNRLHTVNPNDKALQATPTPIGTSITVDKQNVKLTDKQAYDLQKQVGQAIQTRWNQHIQTPEYKAMDDTQKAAALNNIKGLATEDTQRAYVVKNNLGTYSKAESPKAVALAHNANDIASLASSKATGGDTSSIAPKLDGNSKQILTKYNAMTADQRKQATTKQNDFEYKYQQAKYENDKANNKLSRTEDINAQGTLAKAKVGSQFSKDTRDIYGTLSKPEVYDLITRDKNGQQIANNLLKYGDALQQAGIENNKFRTLKTGAETFKPSTTVGVSKAKSGSMKQLATSHNNIASRMSLARKLRNSTIKAKKPSLSAKIASSKQKQYKNPTLYRKKVA